MWQTQCAAAGYMRNATCLLGNMSQVCVGTENGAGPYTQEGVAGEPQNQTPGKPDANANPQKPKLCIPHVYNHQELAMAKRVVSRHRVAGPCDIKDPAPLM